MLFSIIVATIIVSLVSFVGILITNKQIDKFLHYLISFAAATLISVVFFDLIPDAFESFSSSEIISSLVYVVGGIVLFFLIETFLHWHHCGEEGCNEKHHSQHAHTKPAGTLILGGDFFHNFFDGVLIAGAFLLNYTTGIFVTLSVLIHEIPHEVGNYAVLIHSGFKKKRALLLNFYSALAAVFGGILGYFVLESLKSILPYVILVSAGGLLYIALSDIVPSMHEHLREHKTGFIEVSIFILTIVAFKFFLEAFH